MKTITLLVAITISNFALPTWASDHKATHNMSREPNEEDREKMAVAHTQMATCLRSTQEFMQCRDILHKACKSMKDEYCHGMEMGKGMRLKNRN